MRTESGWRGASGKSQTSPVKAAGQGICSFGTLSPCISTPIYILLPLEPCSQLASVWAEAPRTESVSFQFKPQTHSLKSV